MAVRRSGAALFWAEGEACCCPILRHKQEKLQKMSREADIGRWKIQTSSKRGAEKWMMQG